MAAGHSLIKRVLFATDFSTCAHHAEEYVASLSTVYGATVEVLHVLELYPGIYPAVQDHQETDERLADAVHRLQRKTIPVTGHQMIGIPSVQICQAAMQHDTDLIVLGTHGRTGLEHIILGSTAERVLTIAPCPVLTVREPEGPERRHTGVPITFEHIVVSIDFSDCSMDALEYGIQMAKDVGASLTLLHVLEPVSYGDDLTLGHTPDQGRVDQQVDSQLRAYVTTIQSAGVSARQMIRSGVPADSILECVRSSACDLIVMGTHGRRGISRILNGSVAEVVLCRASCPVFAVRTPKFASGRQRMMQMETEPMRRPT